MSHSVSRSFILFETYQAGACGPLVLPHATRHVDKRGKRSLISSVYLQMTRLQFSPLVFACMVVPHDTPPKPMCSRVSAESFCSQVGCCKNPVSFAIPRNVVIVFTLIVFSGESIKASLVEDHKSKDVTLVVVLVIYMVLLQDPVALPVPRRTPSLVVKTWQQQRSDIDS